MRQALTSIQFKVFGVFCALTFVLVGFLATYFSTRQIASVTQGMEDKATTYARLISKQVEPGVAFDDRETVREVFAATAADRDVSAIALYKSNGQLLSAIGELAGGAAPITAPGDAVRVDATRRYIRSIVPVVSREGPTGTLVLELATGKVDAERARIQRVAIGVGLGAFVVGFLAAWLVGRSLARRLRIIAKATQAVAGGDSPSPAIQDTSSDEVGQLARAFDTMSANIRSLVQDIRAANSELAARHRDLRVVFDHVEQGLLTIDRDGVLSAERSRILEEWLGVAPTGTTLWDYVSASDPVAGEWLQLGWNMALEDVLPLELALDQMPRSFRKGERQFRLEYRPILVDGTVSKLLVVVSDVTSHIAREKADAGQRELLGMFDRLMQDRAGFAEFFSEADAFVTKIVAASDLTPDLLRWIHTLKGNCATFGVTSVVELCHALEGTIVETCEPPSAQQRRDLAERWRDTSVKFASLVGDGKSTGVMLDQGEYDRHFDAIRAGAPHEKLAREVWRWRMEPTARRLDRVAQQARGIAQRLGKSVRVVVEPNELRLDTRSWVPFWAAMVHVLRNALDHGIEAEDVRVAADKPVPGTLHLRTFLDGPEFVVEIADDGGGIDWDGLAERARARGLASSTRHDLEEVLFYDGVSTKTETTEHSGRGVGMGAIRAACSALGGVVHVTSISGQGTTLRFRFPAGAMGDGYASARPLRSVAPAA